MRRYVVPLAFRDRGPEEAGRSEDVLKRRPEVLERVVRLPVMRSRG
jgi:hypothetical protein